MGLVDTGSTISVIHPSIVAMISRNVSVPQSSRTGRIRLADGSVTSSLGLVSLGLRFGTCEGLWPQMVVADIEVPVIIGVDFLRAHQCTLDVRACVLLMNGATHVCRRMEAMPHIFRVTVAETVTIPAMSEMVVPGKIDDTAPLTQGIVESCGQQLCGGNVTLARAVVNPAEEVLPLRVMNMSLEPQTLYRDTHVAMCEPVASVGGPLSSEKATSQTVDVDKLQLPKHVQQMIEECQDLLTREQQDLAESLLSNFIPDFAKSKDDLSRTSVVHHGMTMLSKERVKMGPRRLVLAKREALKLELERLLKLGVIEPSKSCWASPVVLVTKKDGSIRLCVDYRRVNDLTLKDSYPLPRIDDSIDTLRGSKWFSTLDLASGYWQVPMDSKDIDKTAFTTPFGLYHFTVMPFGLANAPATFERMMEQVLSGLHWEICLIYIDDVIVFSRTFEEHLVRLHQVLSRIKEANLKLSPSKCKLSRHSVEYLGHVVSQGGVGTDPKKIEAITEWPTPRSIRDVRSFVGLCSYYRRFVRGFADIARPLHQIVALDEFQWSDECARAFATLKEALTSPPILGYPADEGIFVLDTDASGHGLGAVLSQMQDGNERVISYFSRVLTRPEQQYCVTRRELLALVESVKYFHHYLLGRHFVVRTDHGSLKWLMRFKNPEGQMWQWIRVLSTYDFEIQHRPGKQHGNADGLSRRPCQECRHCERQEFKEQSADQEGLDHRICAVTSEPIERTDRWCEPWSVEQIRAWQAEDTDIALALMWKQASRKPAWKDVKKESVVARTYWSMLERLCVLDGILYRSPDPDSKFSAPRLVAPRAIRDQIFIFLHANRTGGHLGINRTASSTRRRFWWPGMKNDMIHWCRHCELCQHHNLSSGPHRSSLHQEPVGAPMERLAFDILSFPVETTEGNTCVLVICDYFTKWVEAFSLMDHRAMTVADVLVTEIFLRFGVPRYLHSDQAPEFMSELMTELCELLEVQRTRTTPYRPQSDGLVERFNRTLIDMLSKFCNERQDDWDQHLPYLLSAYRSSVNESTGCTPNLLMLGRETTLPVDLMYPSTQYQKYRCHNEYVEWIRHSLQDSYERAQHQLQAVSKRQKRYYDVRTKDRQYCEGDFVLRFYPPNLKSKLNSPYIGPFRVMAKLGDVTYKIQRTPQSKPVVVHVDHLKIFHADAPPKAWSSPEIDAQDVLLEGDSPEVGDTDGRDEDVSVHENSSVGHTPESNVEPSILEKEAGPTPPAHQFPRRSSRKRCLPVHLRDYDMA